MQKIKMVMNDGSIQEKNACEVLGHLNDCSSIAELGQTWRTTGKKDFLMGKELAIHAEIAEPLTEEQADIALQEYRELGYR